MNYNRLRPYTAVTMLLALILLVITGWILYLAPHGPGSQPWLLLGASKHLYKDIHFCLAIVVTVLVLLHSFLNIKPLTHYFNRASKTGIGPLLCALIVVFSTLAIASVL